MTAPTSPLKVIIKRASVVVIFSIAFAYIEAAVVVYLRTIFHPDGFTFPLTNFGLSPLWEQLLAIEVGREAATMVLIVAGCYLGGRNTRQRVAYFLTIFAVWDIFYYIWLKVFIDWPASIMDWDILFLIPVIWASPLLAPVLASLIMLAFAAIILYRDSHDEGIKVTLIDMLGFFAASIIIVVSFFLGGQGVNDGDFETYFHWPLFAAGLLAAVTVFARCLRASDQSKETN